MQLSKSMGTMCLLIAVLWMVAGCGGSGTGGAPEGEAGAESPEADPAASPPSGLAAEPILYSDAGFSYVGFQQAPLAELHAALGQLAGGRVQLRVIPYMGTDPSTGESVLKGETLYVYVQQPDADLATLKARGDEVITQVQQAFPELRENYSVEVHARLPTGNTVADLEPALSDACGDRNMVRTGVKLAEFGPGNPGALFEFLCDGAKVMDPYFIEEGWDRIPGAWRTTADR